MEKICTFREDGWFSGTKFTVTVQSASTNEETANFNLENIGGRKFKDVQAIVFTNLSLSVFPLNLTKKFPNLTALQLTNCGLTEISKTDLIGLEGLVELNLNGNKLQSLPSDLLSDMKNLKWIDLYGNEIQYLDSKMFDGIKNQIEFLNLSSNNSISVCYQRIQGRSIDDFMRIIDNQCEKPVNESPKNLLAEIYESEKFPQKTLKYFQHLWLTRRFSDFTIVVGEAEFKVHKTVLAMQSEVFDAMFENELEERKTNRMAISDFSSAAFEDFLCFLYNGKIQSKLNSMELFSLAAKYDVADLKAIAEEIIRYNVDESNALAVLVLANLYDSEVLMETSFEFVKRAHPEITFNESLMNKPEAVKRIIDAKVRHDKVVEEAKEEARKELEMVINDEV